jgi:Xaa-Pro aminopeptidase
MYQSDFTLDEFKARRRKVCEAIGKDAVALLPGAPGPKGSDTFCQYNDFYYLCGVESPRAYLLIHGATERTSLFLQRESQLDRQSPGDLICADNPEFVCTTTGVDQALPIERLAQRLQLASIVYLPFEDGQTVGVNRHHARSWVNQVYSDPWDGRPTRADHLIATIRQRYPHLEIRSLSGLMDELRLIKSPAEIEMLRRAGHLTAVAVNEAMRSTRPGAMEYQLDAVMRYHFLAGGARDQAYHAIIASGPNMWYGHYSRNDSEMKDGDWVLCDGAPSYHYYVSDIGRTWPINGTYTQAQREMYGFVVEYHKVLLAAIRPGRMLEEIRVEAAETMEGVLDGWTFTSPVHEQAARDMFEFRGHLSHCVGMSVHDAEGHGARPLEPGVVFSVDPQMRVPDEKLYIRAEDTVVVTEDGIENLTAEAPLELDDVEVMMTQDGLLQAFPPA